RRRRLPWRSAGGTRPAALRVLHLVLPASDRRTDRALRNSAAATPAQAQLRSGPSARGAAAVRARAGEEDARGGQLRNLGQPLPRPPVLAARVRSVGSDRRFRLPDLLRLQRVLRHGARPRANLRDRAALELQPALPCREPDRVLAPLARDALHLAA